LNRGVSVRPAGRGADRGERIEARAPVRLVRNATTGMPEYGMEEVNPSAVLRGRSADVIPSTPPATALNDLSTDHSYLDIPAFLRRQAD
jgi:cell division protein FtsZ